ncbi:MAG: lysophospholipid acyltransferase family protein, partial [Myxococcota bacterium]|nr:lysophospholipid acyltransferase family protein [Myxococcota bacterium]
MGAFIATNPAPRYDPLSMLILQTLSAYLCALVVTPLFAFVIGLMAIPDRSGRVWARVLQHWGRVCLLMAGSRGLLVEGEEAFDTPGGRVVMANHQSHLDPPTICRVCPYPIRFIAKRSLFFLPIFGQAMWLAGMISIDRRNRERAFASIDLAVKRVRKGYTVLVFPEGTRATSPEMLPYKKGGFVLAIQSGVPIIPVGIAGTERMIPPGWRCHARSHVSVVVGDPIDTTGHSMESRDELIRTVREQIEVLRSRAQQRLEQAESGAS